VPRGATILHLQGINSAKNVFEDPGLYVRAWARWNSGASLWDFKQLSYIVLGHAGVFDIQNCERMKD
jgi:hypothetical protein